MSFLGRRAIEKIPAPQLNTSVAAIEEAMLRQGDEYRPGGGKSSSSVRPSSTPVNFGTGEIDGIALPDRGERRRGCGNPECARSWALPWRSRRRPIFETQWACGRQCMRTILALAVRRERGEGRPEMEPQEHRHRVPLGLVMLAQGWITHP